MIGKFASAAALLAMAAATSACDLVTSTSRAVFVLFDASGTYAASVPTAARSASLLISDLQPGDWIGVGQISSCSFSEKEIIAQQLLPETPSRASEAKREMFNRLQAYSESVEPTKFTDIHGALAQAAFELRQRPEGSRHIVVFSDMVEDLAADCNTAGAKLDLTGISVVASNVIKSDPANPDKYFEMLDEWERIVTEAGGTWDMALSPDQLPALVVGQ